jgi:CHAT domain-containing protein
MRAASPRAVRAHERALDLQRAAQGPEAPATATTLAALGLNLALDGRIADARRAFERAGRLVERAPGQERRARYLLYRAAFARQEGDLPTARGMAEEAVRLREAAYGAEAPETAQARATLGSVLADLGEVPTARRLLEGARAVLERERERTGQLFVRARLAALERAAGRPEAARDHARAALRASRALFGDGPTTIGLLVELGRIERAGGRVETALEALDEATRLAEAALGDGYRHPAEAVEVQLDLLLEAAERRPTERPALLARAWRVGQLAPPSRLADVERRAAGRLATADAGLGERVRALQEAQERGLAISVELGRLRLEDARAPAADRAAALEAERAELAGRARALEREIQVRFPRYGALLATRVVPAEEAAALLAPAEAMLRLVVTPEASFVLALGADGRIAAHRAGLGRAALTETVQRLRATLGFAEGLRPFDRESARALHEALLAPLAPALAGRDHLLLVPDGPLQAVPFGLLLVADGPQPRFLAAERAISVLPAVASLPLARSRGDRLPAPEPFLGVGDPVLAGGSGARGALASASEACREDEPLDSRLLRALPPLPETALELRRVARALGSGADKLVLGPEAKEPVIRRLPLGRYRVIGFATHGLLPGEVRCASEPALVLTPPARPGPDDDGLLAASEIALLELDAEWVSLSACNTAAGGPGGGEALGGLAGAFLRAGARRVLARHWEVDSDATVALVTTTFEAFARDPAAGAARALRTAQRRLLADPRFAHPSFWAAFSLVGDGGPEAGLRARARP